MAPASSRSRLDNLLVSLGLAESRHKAQALILAGLVRVDGQTASRPAAAIPPEAKIELLGREHPYVSRGGVKLAHGLDFFGLDPSGLSCLDLGASTGGFTDCLLQRGARRVTAVDVGYGQLDLKLRQDPRVKVLERTNARLLTPDLLDAPVEALTADVSFISLTLALPSALSLLTPGGWLLVLVKPQFEVGKGQVGKGGVVKDETLRQAAVQKITAWLQSQNLTPLGHTPSPILGPKGNQEYLLAALKPRGE